MKDGSTARCFVALALDEETRNHIDRVARSLDESLGVLADPLRFTASSGYHVTLRYLGESTRAQQLQVAEALDEVARSFRPLDLVFRGIGAFPDLAMPRVIWLGLEDRSGQLERLQAGVEAAVGRIGYGEDRLPFRPHLTLARMRRDATDDAVHALGAALEASEGALAIATLCGDVALYETRMTDRGPRYGVLSSAVMLPTSGA